MALGKPVRHCKRCGDKRCDDCTDNPRERKKYGEECCVYCGRDFEEPCELCRPNSWLIKRQTEEIASSVVYRDPTPYFVWIALVFLALTIGFPAAGVFMVVLGIGLIWGYMIPRHGKCSFNLYYPPDEKKLGIQLVFDNHVDAQHYMGLEGLDRLTRYVCTNKKYNKCDYPPELDKRYFKTDYPYELIDKVFKDVLDSTAPLERHNQIVTFDKKIMNPLQDFDINKKTPEILKVDVNGVYDEEGTF